MKTLLTIIGARPQIIKSAAISKTIESLYSESINEILVHTGQHFDKNMSEVFFTELGMSPENFNLGISGGSRIEQLTLMQTGIEELIDSTSPDAILVYGDTNSTLAGARAAENKSIPIFHIEAGLRSFNQAMPEELNRIETDKLSTLLFVPTPTGIMNLKKEGVTK